MENEKKSFSLKASETFLKGTLFLLFGPKKWQEGKRPIPPIYILGGIIIFLIFMLIVKKVTTRRASYYPTERPAYETVPPERFRPQAPLPGGY